jgi:hypothetical protein
MPIIVISDPADQVPTWEFDPVSEDAANAPLDVSTGSDYAVVEWSAPSPSPEILYASSVDTEGERLASTRYRNRTVSITIRVNGAAQLATLEGKIAKLTRKGPGGVSGTLKHTDQEGEVRIFDVVSVTGYEFTYDHLHSRQNITMARITLECWPFKRGEEQDLGDNVETTLPCLRFTDTIPGDVDALGRLEIDNDQATAQGWAIWGVRSRYYSSDASAALFFQAEACTISSGAAAVGPAGASGSGSNTVLHSALDSAIYDNTIILGTGSTPRTSHLGAYRVFTRVQVPNTNTGTVSVRLDWSGGNVTTENDPVSIDPSYEASWRILDLGQVDIQPRLTGTDGWDGVLAATSTVTGDDIYFDWIMLVPIDESSGEVSTGSTNTDPVQASAGLSVRWNGVASQGSSGSTDWFNSPNFRGDRLRLPPAGAEGRTCEVIVKMSRGVPLTEADSATDDLSARLYVTPRYL